MFAYPSPYHRENASTLLWRLDLGPTKDYIRINIDDFWNLILKLHEKRIPIKILLYIKL